MKKLNTFFIVITLAFCILPSLTEGNTNNKHNNAIWMGYRWVVDYHSPEEIADTLSIIESHDINTIYVNVGLLNNDGTMDYATHYWHFLKYIKLNNDSLKAIAWVNGNSDSTDISQDSVRNNITDVCSLLVFGSQWAIDHGYNDFFDGVQIDIEPIGSGNSDYIALLDSIKIIIGEKILCTVGFPWAMEKLLWRWGSAYYNTISNHVDQIAVMTYNSGSKSSCEYIDWYKNQVIEITKAVNNDNESYLYFGVITLDDTATYHHPDFENIRNGIIGIITALNDPSCINSVFAGPAIYGYWSTDSNEWAVWEQLWIHELFSKNKFVLAHYLPWYSSTGRHWDCDNLGGHTGNPLIGKYDSGNSAVIEYHVLQAYAAGIDGFVINWYGQTSFEDSVFAIIINKVDSMNAEYTQLNFKVCISYDEQALNEGHFISEDFRYIGNNYIMNETYRETYLWDENIGKPVLFIFPKCTKACYYKIVANSVIIDSTLIIWKESQQHEYVDSNYPWVQPSDDSLDWGEVYLNWFYPDMQKFLHSAEIFFVTGGVWPGFDNRNVCWPGAVYRFMSRQEGSVYKSTWDKVHHYDSLWCNFSLPWVQIETWNDWNEGTTIEPSDSTWYGYQYLQLTEDHIEKFKDLSNDDLLDIYVAEHIYKARIEGRYNLLDSALITFFNGDYKKAIELADFSKVTSIAKDKIFVSPYTYTLFQNYPNPFNMVTRLEYHIPKSGNIKIVIYNIKGEVVRNLLEVYCTPGYHFIDWDGCDNNGNQVGTGIYFYHLEIKNKYSDTKKMILMK